MALAEARPELFGTTVVGVALLSASAGHLLEVGVSRRGADVLRRTHALAPGLRLLWFTAPVLDRLSLMGTATARRRLRRRLFGTGPVSPVVLDAVQATFEHTRPSVLAAFAPALLHHERAGALRHLRGLPTLVLAGDHDRTIPCAHSERIAAELGERCELVVVPGAGHLVNVSHPEQVSSALIGLLRRVRAGGASGDACVRRCPA